MRTVPEGFTPESKRLNVLLKEFRSNRNHIAIVVHLPKRGERVHFDDFEFTVLRTDSRRLHTLKVARLGAAP